MNGPEFFFAGWASIVRIAVVGTAMYAALLSFLRLSGSRTLASLNAFDFVITVAIGAAFGRSLTAETVALAEAVTAFGLLIGLQYVVAWLRTRSERFERAITNPPRLLYYRGAFVGDAMRGRRVTEDELMTAVRGEGLGSLDEVDALVLEPTGDVAVVQSLGDGSALDGITPEPVGVPDDADGDVEGDDGD